MTSSQQIAKDKSTAKTVSRRFQGVVVSDKNDQTIVVLVERVKKHPKYQKRYTVSRKYKVHDATNEYKIGDTVTFVECRPLSRDKKWRTLKKVS